MCSSRSQLSFRCGILWEHWLEIFLMPGSLHFLSSAVLLILDSVALADDLPACFIYSFYMGRGHYESGFWIWFWIVFYELNNGMHCILSARSS